MGSNFLQRLAINEDVEAEFLFWKNQLVSTAWLAVACAFGTGFLIAAWPQGFGNTEVRDFVRDIWVLVVEFAFWTGFLLGLLWGAAKRMGSSLAGTLPWQPERELSARLVSARFFGQWAAYFSLLWVFLSISLQFALRAEARLFELINALELLAQASLASALVFGVVAIAGRRRPLDNKMHNG